MSREKNTLIALLRKVEILGQRHPHITGSKRFAYSEDLAVLAGEMADLLEQGKDEDEGLFVMAFLPRSDYEQLFMGLGGPSATEMFEAVAAHVETSPQLKTSNSVLRNYREMRCRADSQR